MYRLIGNLLISLSVFFIAKTFYAPVQAEIRYFADTKVFKRTYVVADSPVDVPLDTSGEQQNTSPSAQSQILSWLEPNTQSVLVPVDPQFSVVVPKIAANSRVVANVNPADEEEYLEKLKFGVAHAAGTLLPGQGGNIFLFAHSTDYVWNISSYNAVFYLLYKLEAGDELDLFFEGRRYRYVVFDKKTVAPDEVSHLVEPTSFEQVTLQTCWPPGTTLQRLLVFAKRKVV